MKGRLVKVQTRLFMAHQKGDGELLTIEGGHVDKEDLMFEECMNFLCTLLFLLKKERNVYMLEEHTREERKLYWSCIRISGFCITGISTGRTPYRIL